MGAKMPVLFIGHGSPMNIILTNSYTRSLAALGKRMPQPRAILVVSAHWLTQGSFVACTDRPRTIHDFYGFPEELYAVRYACPGSPADARFVAESARTAPVGCNDEWGLDHAAWAVLKHLYPAADIPVFEMSLDYTYGDWHPKPVRYHYELAKELSGLREKGVLIIGSGNIVHNLSLIDFGGMDAEPYPWARDFDEQVKGNLLAKNHHDLINYQSMGKASSLAVPSLDHYLPMIYAIALQDGNEPLTFIHEGFQNASISMRCFQVG